MYAPIALFVYKRLNHTKRTLKALQKNTLAQESELFVYSDGWKNEEDREKVEEIRNYLKTISGFKHLEIIKKEKNEGLANSIIAGVTDIVNKYGKVIVLEDDLVSSPYFLQFMNDALNLYENEERVASVHGYVYPIKGTLPDTFFLKHTSSWGWGTWKRAWELFEPDGKKLMQILEQKKLINELNINGTYNFVGMLRRQIAGITNSWAIRWDASCLIHNKLNLYPNKSLIKNIGQDGTGEHRGNSNKHDVILYDSPIKVERIQIIAMPDIMKTFERFFRSLKPSFTKRIKWKLQKIMGKSK